MWTFIIVAVILLFIIGAWFNMTETKLHAEKTGTALSAIPNFNPVATTALTAGRYTVSMDPVSSQFALITPLGVARVYKFDQLVAIEVDRNGTSITKTNRGSQAAGAAVGGLLLGPAGLLLGGLSGSKRNEDKVTRLSLRVFTNDFTNPSTEIVFGEYPGGSDPNSFAVKHDIQTLNEWYGRFQTILHIGSKT